MIMQLYRWKYELVHILVWVILFIRKVSGKNDEKYLSYFQCWFQQKVRKKVQHLIALSLTWLKHVHFAPKSFFRDQVMVYGIKIWFARRWDCNTPVEIHQFYDCQWINLYKCMLTHYSMVTPYQLNYIPIRSWFILLNFISISAFPPESRTRKTANCPSI